MADDALSKEWRPQKEELVGFGEIRSAFAGVGGSRAVAAQTRKEDFRVASTKPKGPLREKAED